MKLRDLTVVLTLSGCALAVGSSGCTGGDSGGDSVLPGVNSLVFVKRSFNAGSIEAVSDGNSQVIDYGRYVPGDAAHPGGLFTLTPPRPDGALNNLTAAFDGVDINGMDLSFDAKQVVFSMQCAHGPDGVSCDGHYHIFITNVDGTGGVHQLTSYDADDVTPIFVPGGRIAFVTNEAYTEMGTRADEYEHARVVSQLATISLMTGDADRRLCAQNLSHTATPFLMSDGTIGYSRWEHLGPVNDVKLFHVNPDCTNMLAVAGQHNKPFNSIVQAQELSPGVFVGIGTSRSRTIQAGALVQIDARAGAGADPTVPLNEQNATFTVLTEAVPTDAVDPASGVGRYRSPHALPASFGGKIVVSWADGEVDDRNEIAATAPQFGMYMWDPNTKNRTLIYDDPAMWDLYATPVVPRDEPAMRAPTNPGTLDYATPAVLGSVDVTQTSLSEGVSTYNSGFLDGQTLAQGLTHATHVRIVEGFSAEIGGGVGQFGLTMHEGAAIMGETPVHSDGSWSASLPPYLPYHLQPIDEYGMAIRNQLLWVQAMPGENRRCGGCHESRVDTVIPRTGSTTIAQQMGPENLVKSIRDRIELPWAGATDPGTNVQDFLTTNCASCHSGGAGDPFAGQYYIVTVTPEGSTTPQMYRIPVLDLSAAPTEVYYEREVRTYPASYVSLLYPSAMMGDAMVTGGTAAPIEWVTPGLARTSRLVAKINQISEADPTQHAFSTALHPENVGGPTLTRDQRMLLIRMADLGGQYYSRRNVDGASMYLSSTYPTYTP